MKRFWDKTSTAREGTGFLIRLDERPLKLPNGSALIVPYHPLALGIADEWAEAGQNFDLDDLPLTRLAATAQDRVAMGRSEIIEQLTRYGLNDLLCYRAADNPALAAREHTTWQPWVDWANQKFNITLTLVAGIVAATQPPECRMAFAAYLNAMTDHQLAGLGVIVPALGSLILGLALECDALTIETACQYAHLEALWQEARWGTDREAIARRADIAQDVATGKRFMVLSRASQRIV
jgi:chaperone required for assembly of F1-ATPase